MHSNKVLFHTYINAFFGYTIGEHTNNRCLSMVDLIYCATSQLPGTGSEVASGHEVLPGNNARLTLTSAT